jgi:hypothetical protein
MLGALGYTVSRTLVKNASGPLLKRHVGTASPVRSCTTDWRLLGASTCSQVHASWPSVQDGMTAADVVPHLTRYHGIFVGGSLHRKLATGAQWAELVRRHGLGCHIGRVGTAARVHWARSIGATRVDSSLPSRAREHLDAFLAAVGPIRHASMLMAA